MKNFVKKILCKKNLIIENFKRTCMILTATEKVWMSCWHFDPSDLWNVTCQGQLQFTRCQIPNFDASKRWVNRFLWVHKPWIYQFSYLSFAPVTNHWLPGSTSTARTHPIWPKWWMNLHEWPWMALNDLEWTWELTWDDSIQFPRCMPFWFWHNWSFSLRNFHFIFIKFLFF